MMREIVREGGARYRYLFLELSWWHGRERLVVAKMSSRNAEPKSDASDDVNFKGMEGLPEGKIYLTEG